MISPEILTGPEILTAWVSAFLTLAILSFLFNDNPLYKAAEHLFAGVSAGYGIVLAYWSFLRPNLFGKLWPKLPETEEGSILLDIWYAFYNIAYNITTLFGFIEPALLTENGIDTSSDEPIIYFSYVIPFILGLLMLFRLIPSLSWLARYSIAYIVGVFAGLRAFSYLNSDILLQVLGVQNDLSLASPFAFINSMILIIGTISALVYFFFSKKHEGALGKISKVGIYFLMISFGASFGFTVMGRISLLIGRFGDLIKYSNPEYHYGALWCLVIVILFLAVYFSVFNKKNNNSSNQEV